MKPSGIEIEEIINKHLEYLKNDVEVYEENNEVVIRIKDIALANVIQYLSKYSSKKCKCLLCILENASLIEKVCKLLNVDVAKVALFKSLINFLLIKYAICKKLPPTCETVKKHFKIVYSKVPELN